jgi:hypothetical protein
LRDFISNYEDYISKETIIMKKIISCILASCLLFIGCDTNVFDDGNRIITEMNNKIEITERTVMRDDTHARRYDEWVISIGHAEYHIEKSEVESQERAEKLAKELNKKAEVLRKLANAAEKDININVVKCNVKTGGEISHAYYDLALNGVYMRADQTDELYTAEALTEMIFDIHNPWLAFGIAGKVSEYETDEEALCLFYSDKDNMDTLGLFGGRFNEKAYGNADMTINTAISFYRYLDGKYGEQIWAELRSADLTVNTAAEKQEWLNSIGCNMSYDYAYSEQLMNYPCYYNAEYDIMVQSSYADFYVDFYDKEASVMKDSLILERLLNNNLDAYSRYIELAQQEDFADYITKKRIECYVNEESTEKRTVTEHNEILLFGWSFEYAHAHELAHAMLQHNGEYEDKGSISSWWLNEGFATYISASLPIEDSTFSNWRGLKDTDFDYVCLQRMQDYGFDGTTYPEMSDAARFEQCLWDRYCEKGSLEDQSDFDKARYYDAFTKAYLNTQQFNMLNTDTPYELLASFTQFLIEQYSWQEVVSVICNMDSYQNVFGRSFEELIQEWRSLYVD